MTDNPLVKVLERMTGMARLHGKAFCKITWDPIKEEYNFSVILPEHIIVTYEGKAHD